MMLRQVVMLPPCNIPNLASLDAHSEISDEKPNVDEIITS
jgi:hypothetical protein